MLKALPSCNLVNCFCLPSLLDYCLILQFLRVCTPSPPKRKQLNTMQVSWRLFFAFAAPKLLHYTQFNAQLKWMQRRVTFAICLCFKSTLSISLSLARYRLPAGTCSSQLATVALAACRLQTWRLSDCHKLCSNFCVSSSIHSAPAAPVPLPPT